MKLRFLACLLVVTGVQAECVLQSNTTSKHDLRIEERSGNMQDVVRMPDGTMRCQVAFRARIGTQWHTAMGSYDFKQDQSPGEACTIAQQRAETSLAQRLASSAVATDSVMTCRDQPSFDTLRETKVGTIGWLHQFRPHPNYPKRFWHNGAQCQMFIDQTFSQGDVKVWQGVICNLQDSKWVVIDKF